jgi:hypothetical protein
MKKLNLEIGYLRKKLNGNEANKTPSAVFTSPQVSAMIRVTDVGQQSSQVSSAVSESDSHISPSVNGVSVFNVSACNHVSNTNTIATSCTENVSAPSETFVNTSQYSAIIS